MFPNIKRTHYCKTHGFWSVLSPPEFFHGRYIGYKGSRKNYSNFSPKNVIFVSSSKKEKKTAFKLLKTHQKMSDFDKKIKNVFFSSVTVPTAPPPPSPLQDWPILPSNAVQGGSGKNEKLKGKTRPFSSRFWREKMFKPRV